MKKLLEFFIILWCIPIILLSVFLGYEVRIDVNEEGCAISDDDISSIGK